MGNIKDVAKRVAAAKVFGQGSYLRCGKGVLVIDSIVYKEEAFKGPIIVAEFKVESSETDPAARDPKGQPILANAPGTSVSKVWTLYGENREMFLGKVKEFVQTLDGDAEADVSDLLEQVCAEEQPARGMRIAYEAFLTTTKKNKNIITVEKWVSFPNDDASKVTGLAFLNS